MALDYNYNLPEKLIASEPANPRDSARLLVYISAKDEVVTDTFANIGKYLPAGSLLVLNDTKVVPARLRLFRPTGGAVSILFLVNEWDGGTKIKGLPDRFVSIGEPLSLDGRNVVIPRSNEREEFVFDLAVGLEEFRRIIETHGRTPLPPYIHSEMDESRIRTEYQTTFAEKPASVAAPTASLHFTDGVFAALEKKGILHTEVTLHVGRGTFSPVTPEVEKSGSLHAEPVSVSADASRTIRDARKNGHMVVASGTTALRALESAANSIIQGVPFGGATTLFIKPPYDFKIVDGLITNFHLPGTSLIMLLDAFLQSKGSKRSWRDLYELAMRDGFRFYSFGDAMLVL